MTDNTLHKTTSNSPEPSPNGIQARAEALATADEKIVNTPETLEDIVTSKEKPGAPGLMTPDLALATGVPLGQDEKPADESTPAAEAAETDIKKRSKFSKFALISLILTLVAWLMLMLPWKNGGIVAMVIAIVSVVTSILGLRSPRRGWRDIATTSLIASAVLAVIVLAFIIVLYVVL